MRLAVTYDNGRIAPHFGKTKHFKIYDIDDDKLLKSEVVAVDEGIGHEKMVAFVAGLGVDAVICGSAGDGAVRGLKENGIIAFVGIEGDADEIIKSILEGNVDSSEGSCGGNCNCDGDCGGGCGGGCGCGGCGCGEPKFRFEGPNVGKICRVHYRGTFNDGVVFDSSYDREEPIEFVCGIGMMIPGFDKAVADMEVGESKDIHLMPEEAYGQRREDMIITIPLAQLPGAETYGPGEQLYLLNGMGQPHEFTVVSKTDDEITLDGNHEMAGKELNFHLELVEIMSGS